MTATSQSGPGPGAPSGARGPLTAGLDVGTSSVKGVVVDENGLIVEEGRLPIATVVGRGGRFEHDAAAAWWESPRILLAQLLTAPAVQDRRSGGAAVEAVAVSAMMPSVTAVDAAGRPIGPGLLYGDDRGRLSPAPASSDDTGAGGSGSASASNSGSDPTASDEMARLAGWAASQAPEAYGLWPAQSVANAALSGRGEGVIDLASAFAAGPLFGGSGWDELVCARAGLRPAQLPTVAMFGQAVGHLGPEALPGEGHGEIVLGAGSVDGLCEQLVAGAVGDGDVLVALGSTLVVWLCVPGWPEEVPGLWRVPHIVGGKAMVGGASNAGGMWVDWADRVLRPGPPDAENSLQPGDVPLWWPWARGERVPWHDPSLRISLGGADLSQGPAAMRRAVLEATGFVVRHVVELASSSGTKPKRYILSGGGTANPLWRQALADVLGEPVTPMETSHGAAVGAAFLARMAAGLETTTDDAARWVRWSAPVDPRQEWSRAAGERYQRWCQELPARA